MVFLIFANFNKNQLPLGAPCFRITELPAKARIFLIRDHLVRFIVVQNNTSVIYNKMGHAFPGT